MLFLILHSHHLEAVIKKTKCSKHTGVYKEESKKHSMWFSTKRLAFEDKVGYKTRHYHV